jgi:hypothetical protein
MEPAGMAIIDLGKKNGSWVRLDHVERFVVPPENCRISCRSKAEGNSQIIILKINTKKIMASF